jgi:hypothetical protein
MKTYRKESAFTLAIIWGYVAAIVIALIVMLIQGNPFKDIQGEIFGISIKLFIGIFFFVVLALSLLVTVVYRAIFYEDVLGFDISLRDTELVLKKNGTQRIDLTKITEFGRYSFGRSNTAFYVIVNGKETAVCTPDNLRLLQDAKEVLENKGLAYVRTYDAKIHIGKITFEKYLVKEKSVDVSVDKSEK